jgi:hypothetical protein
MSMKHWWNHTERGKQNYSEKACPSATLSITNLAQMGLWLCPDPVVRPPTNNLSHGMAQKMLSVTLVIRFEILLRENTKISLRRLQSCYLSYLYRTLIDVMCHRFVRFLHIKFQMETFLGNDSSYMWADCMCSVNVKHSLKILQTSKVLVARTSQLDRFCFMA